MTISQIIISDYNMHSVLYNLTESYDPFDHYGFQRICERFFDACNIFNYWGAFPNYSEWEHVRYDVIIGAVAYALGDIVEGFDPED